MTDKKTERVQRIPLHKTAALAADPRKGFMRRWVTEVQGRVERFLAAGWTIVEGQENDVSDKKVQSGSSIGSTVRRVVNRMSGASAQTAVLMEIKEEYYREDQAAKMAILDEKEKVLDPSKGTVHGADYGSMHKSYGIMGK